VSLCTTARTLDDESVAAADQSLYPTVALGSFSERRIRDSLFEREGVVAPVALVLIRGHDEDLLVNDTPVVTCSVSLRGSI
jgi:hypothetical protein